MRFLTVSEFLTGVNTVLAGVPACIEGEVSGFSVRQDRWAFFSLKDGAGVVECFMPAWKLHCPVEDGMLVRIAGVPHVYEKNGRFRITVEALELAGDGSLRRAFEIQKQQLEAEGLFAAARKRPLPRYPEVIGLIASTESAAYTDFLRILRNRWGGVTILVQDVAVQGANAVEEIVSAFRHWTSVSGPDGVPEVLVLVRGGGSLEDLQAFNTEEVARAIFRSPIPVVVGVGHERDVTIADLVADQRASTPSNAAELVVPDRREVATTIQALVAGMSAPLAMATARHRAQMMRFVTHGGAFARRRLAWVFERAQLLRARMSFLAARSRDRCASAERLLANLNPERLLARGYSMTFSGGKIVRDARFLQSGDALRTQFANGSVKSVVT